jgi:hypothetical protein
LIKEALEKGARASQQPSDRGTIGSRAAESLSVEPLSDAHSIAPQQQMYARDSTGMFEDLDDESEPSNSVGFSTDSLKKLIQEALSRPKLTTSEIEVGSSRSIAPQQQRSDHGSIEVTMADKAHRSTDTPINAGEFLLIMHPHLLLTPSMRVNRNVRRSILIY